MFTKLMIIASARRAFGSRGSYPEAWLETKIVPRLGFVLHALGKVFAGFLQPTLTTWTKCRQWGRIYLTDFRNALEDIT